MQADWLVLLLEPLTDGVRAAVTDPTTLCATFGYLLLAPLLRRSPWVDRSKGAYRRCMVFYNLTMAAYSIACFFVTATALGWDRGYGNWLRALSGDDPLRPPRLYTNVCPSPVFDSPLFMWAAKSFLVSKYIEYLDTVWLVLKGKSVSFLQTFHHFGAPWDVHLGIAFRNEGLWIFLFLNTFVHTVMYFYYAATAAGVRVPGKPLITLLQLTQFFYGFYIVWGYIDIPCFRQDQGLVLSWLFNYAYVGTVMLSFLHFFYSNYHAGKSRKGKSA